MMKKIAHVQAKTLVYQSTPYYCGIKKKKMYILKKNHHNVHSELITVMMMSCMGALWKEKVKSLELILL